MPPARHRPSPPPDGCIRCDDTLNTPSVIQSGEVRMEGGVALAEFSIIRV